MRVIVLLAMIGTAFAASLNSSRIVGGSDTNIQAYPFMASINRQQFGWIWSHICGGTLLTSRSILSASHCFEDESLYSYRVRLGSDQRSSGGTILNVATVILHPTYTDATMNYDVAIVTLETLAIFSNNIKPARIAGVNFQLPDATSVVSLGWGQIWYLGPLAETLQYVTTNIINQDTCAERYAYLKTLPFYGNWPDITSQMICAGILNVGGKDACLGDSGGPLVYQDDIIIGVTSWGYECADEFYPGVYARVSALSGWIQANA